ncbi:hypothetical protein CGUA_03495 [Corynebacterium guangdongense]|uniref:DUF3152 domain-containing protein n=1 Tax=Corynebacterium guangdongense TaxID=1783348 RepID=A0ABU1ZUW2_9CORY|nr:hypothetical protein [Corynebacterium guangdongense]WJZ17295.1 hypothetical protein CGUA_03495 [Corynebacterium guangdongense]
MSSTSSTGDPRPAGAHDSGPRDGEQPDQPPAQESALVRFAREWGWRAYAIPVLTVITIWLLADVMFFPAAEDTAAGAPDTTVTAAGTGSGRTVEEPTATRGPGPDPATHGGVAVPPTELPAGGAFTGQGARTFHTVGVPGMVAGEGTETVVRYVLEVEDGVDTSRYGGGDGFARMVDATLADPRGWTNDPRFRFEHVAPDQDPNLRIRLTSVGTTHELCGNDLEMETSCRTTITGESLVVINESRWVRGAVPFEGDLGSYRQYLVNHEVGHALGYQDHVACGENGALAPIMMQQTLSLNNGELNSHAPTEIYPDNDATCRYNAWPYPVPGTSPEDDNNPGAPARHPDDMGR